MQQRPKNSPRNTEAGDLAHHAAPPSGGSGSLNFSLSLGWAVPCTCVVDHVYGGPGGAVRRQGLGGVGSSSSGGGKGAGV